MKKDDEQLLVIVMASIAVILTLFILVSFFGSSSGTTQTTTITKATDYNAIEDNIMSVSYADEFIQYIKVNEDGAIIHLKTAGFTEAQLKGMVKSWTTTVAAGLGGRDTIVVLLYDEYGNHIMTGRYLSSSKTVKVIVE